jgi:hypothetical protein
MSGLVQCARCGKPAGQCGGDCNRAEAPPRRSFGDRYQGNMRGLFYVVAAFGGAMVLARAFGVH